MQCPYCKTMNPAQARFCLACGRSLLNGIVCPRCFTLLPPHARYCIHCGEMLVMPQTAALSTSAPQALSGPLVTELVQPQLETATLAELAAPRPLADMLESLRVYLPEKAYEPLERRPSDLQLAAARDRLVALLKMAQTYLPLPVVLAPQPPGVPTGGMQRGTFLLGDMSGFTALSERLSQFGRRGAEMITTIINGLFKEMVGILYDHGGILLKFGGDALLGVFPADSEAQLPETALRAVQTAQAMQKGMEKFAAIDAAGETRALKLKCGISSGPYFAAHIGTRQSMAYVTTGHTVNHADEGQGYAEPGESILAQSTRDLLPDTVQVETRAENYYVLRSAPSADGKASVPSLDIAFEGDLMMQITTLVNRLDRIAPYLPAELIPRIVTNPSDDPDVVLISPDHRQVTVMFANYLGISDLIDDLGESHPEVITQHFNNYFVQMADVVERYEGAVARMDQYTVGDRLVIFFGAPRAHEDDPVRAVYAALDMQDAMREHFAALQTPAGIYRFRQRIGINTGQLFAGNVGAPNLRQEYTLMGDDINMAARLMSKSEWDTVFISKKTRDRVIAFFELESRGDLKVKGKEILIPTFAVKGRREEIGRIRGLESGDSPFTGRGAVLDTLKTCGQNLLSAQRGQIVSIIGDSGTGKSRLTQEFRNWLLAQEGADQILWLRGHALSFSEKVSYWLAVQVLRETLLLKSDASEDDVLFTLWERGEELLGKEIAREAVPFLADLMGLKLEGEWARWVRGLSPEIRQKQTFWAAREFFIAAAKQRPTVIALDDLHWADEASLALFNDLLEVTVQTPLMFILISRKQAQNDCERLRERATTEFPHRHTEISLLPLSSEESGELLARLLPGAAFSNEALQEILDKASGNPFYLEEVVRALIESQSVIPDPAHPGQWRVTAEIENLAVPATLEGAIISRIDRLTENARRALQVASVIGRSFEMRILARLTEAETELGSWLAQLERDDLIRPVGQTAQTTYIFPNALVQEVVYDNLIVTRRQEFHRQVGEAIERMLAERVSDSTDRLTADLDGDGVPEQGSELLAYHFSRSDDPQRAMIYLERAGRKAQAEFANDTAIQHYTDLLERLGESEEWWEKRFEILLRRQRVFGIRGLEDKRETDLETLRALAVAHQDEQRRSDVLNDLVDLYNATSRYDLAEQTAHEALELKTQMGDRKGQAAALYKLGVLHYYRGDYDLSAQTLEQAAGLQRTIEDAEGEAWSVMYLGMIHFVSGRYSDAARMHERAFQLAQARHDGLQVGIHLTNSARVLTRLGRYDEALNKFEQSYQMKIRVGDRMGQGFNLYGIGQIHNYRGQYEKAEMALQEALKVRQQIDDQRGISYCLDGLGQVALGQKNFEQAHDYFQQAHKLHSQLGLKAEMIEDLSFIGQAFLGLGQLEEAQNISRRALDQLIEQGDVPGEEHEIWLNHFRILAAQQSPAAGDMLQKTYQIMIQQADRISDPADRESFLSQVGINREIMAAIQDHS